MRAIFVQLRGKVCVLSLGETRPHEENRPCWSSRLCLDRAFVCAGHCSCCATPGCGGASRPSAAPWLRMGCWLSPLGWCAVCLGAGTLCAATSSSCGLGPGTLGGSPRRMGLCRRALALTLLFSAVHKDPHSRLHPCGGQFCSFPIQAESISASLKIADIDFSA